VPKRTDLRSILVIGSGPIVIGQACEFDYSGTQACKVLRAEGYRVILINSNPATIMTDPELADATYVEPLNLDHLTAVIAKERPDALLPTLGGQTALNLAIEAFEAGVLDEYSVELIGAGVAEERVGSGVDDQVHAEGYGRGPDCGQEVGLLVRVDHPAGRGFGVLEVEADGSGSGEPFDELGRREPVAAFEVDGHRNGD